VVSYLRGGYVEAEEKGYCEAEKGGATEDWIDSDEKANGDAPCEFLWSCSETEEREDGQSDTPVEPAVMDGRRSWSDTCRDDFALIHY